jgi:hypothetical protein
MARGVEGELLKGLGRWGRALGCVRVETNVGLDVCVSFGWFRYARKQLGNCYSLRARGAEPVR